MSSNETDGNGEHWFGKIVDGSGKTGMCRDDADRLAETGHVMDNLTERSNMEAALKKHPAYKEAVERILERFEAEGYGAMISDDEFDEYLSIAPPSEKMTYREFQKYELDRLQRYQAIEELLTEHSMCLIRAKKIAGFEIIEPRQQITIGFDRKYSKAKRCLRKTIELCINIDRDKLTIEEQDDLTKKTNKLAFINAAMKKRKFEISGKGKLKIGSE